MIVSPVIDSISDTTFHYQSTSPDLYGSFNWAMQFEWHSPRKEEEGQGQEQEESEKPIHVWSHHATPVMAGGLFAIDREWFRRIGFYDEGDLQ